MSMAEGGGSNTQGGAEELVVKKVGGDQNASLNKILVFYL